MYIASMMTGGTTLACLAGAAVLCSTAKATADDSSANPYQAIVERNVFGLKSPPPPPDPEANKPPPPKITLTGITTILGNKRALMKVMMPPKPGVKQEEQSFILAVGQRDGDIEVLEIDDAAGTVKVNDFGTITNLSFENNGVKLASGPPPGPPAAVARPMAAPGIPLPPGTPGFPPAPAAYQPRRPYPASGATRLGPTGMPLPPVPQ
jgi:hypothetical protein